MNPLLFKWDIVRRKVWCEAVFYHIGPFNMEIMQRFEGRFWLKILWEDFVASVQLFKQSVPESNWKVLWNRFLFSAIATGVSIVLSSIIRKTSNLDFYVFSISMTFHLTSICMYSLDTMRLMHGLLTIVPCIIPDTYLLSGIPNQYDTIVVMQTQQPPSLDLVGKPFLERWWVVSEHYVVPMEDFNFLLPSNEKNVSGIN